MSILIPTHVDVMWTYHVPSSYLKFRELHFSFDASHRAIVQWISEDVQYQRRSSCQFNSWIDDNWPLSIQCDTLSRIKLFVGVCVTRLKDTIMLHLSIPIDFIVMYIDSGVVLGCMNKVDIIRHSTTSDKLNNEIVCVLRTTQPK